MLLGDFMCWVKPCPSPVCLVIVPNILGPVPVHVPEIAQAHSILICARNYAHVMPVGLKTQPKSSTIQAWMRMTWAMITWNWGWPANLCACAMSSDKKLGLRPVLWYFVLGTSAKPSALDEKSSFLNHLITVRISNKDIDEFWKIYHKMIIFIYFYEIF